MAKTKIEWTEYSRNPVTGCTPVSEGCENCYARRMPNRRSWPDLMGLLQATCDILESAGIIKNDRNVVSLDGSRIMGVDKKNPRAEIEIKEVG